MAVSNEFFQVDKSGIDDLQISWQALIANYCIKSDLSEKYFLEINFHQDMAYCNQKGH